MQAKMANLCGECGYDLTGLTARSEFGVCPECGSRYVHAFPLQLEAWPRIWLVVVKLCGPMLLFAALLVFLSKFWAGPLFLMMAVPLLAAAWVLVGVAVPLLVGGQIAQNCVLRRRQGRVLWSLAIAGWVVNAAVTAAAISMVFKV